MINYNFDLRIEEDGFIKWMTIYNKDGEPIWCKVIYDNDGAYIELDGQKEYVLVSN